MWKAVKRFLGNHNPRATPLQKTGRWGEGAAERYLQAKGYKILGKRFHVGPRDEIDLICRARETLVFVEVKTRASEDFGRPGAAVDRAKRYRLARAALRYLKRLQSRPAGFRFDVVEVVGRAGVQKPAIRHIENAFPLPKYFRVP